MQELIKRGKAFFAALGAKLFRRLSRAVDSGRFASGMALMLSSGLDLDESVEMTEKLMEHPGTKKKIQRMKERMDSGVSFAEAAVETGLFSALHSKMLKIGQQTGSMDTVMHHPQCDFQISYGEVCLGYLLFYEGEAGGVVIFSFRYMCSVYLCLVLHQVADK